MFVYQVENKTHQLELASFHNVGKHKHQKFNLVLSSSNVDSESFYQPWVVGVLVLSVGVVMWELTVYHKTWTVATINSLAPGKWGCNFNPLRPKQNDHHFADDTLNRIFLNENVRISIKISLKFAPKGPINDILALVQIKGLRRPGDKPLSEPMMVSLLTHICFTRPQWVISTHIKHRYLEHFL